MKYTLSWQDFMRQPENKVLKESKGIHACKQKFIQEQNRLMWHDPVIIQENQSPGQSVTSNAAANYGGSTQFITGKTNATATLTWVSGMTVNASASANFGITMHPLNGTTDFSVGSTDSRKKVLLAFITGSTMVDLGGLSSTGYDCVVTASWAEANALTADTSTGNTGSLGAVLADALRTQGAGAIVSGFTNTIAPAGLLSATTSSAGNLTISHAIAGGCLAPSTDVASTTASLSSVNGADTYYHDTVQTFDGQFKPYTNAPRKY